LLGSNRIIKIMKTIVDQVKIKEILSEPLGSIGIIKIMKTIV